MTKLDATRRDTIGGGNRAVRLADARERHATLSVSCERTRPSQVATTRSVRRRALGVPRPRTARRRHPRARASSDDYSVSRSAPSPSSAAAGLAAHVQSLGWDEQEFSDVSVTAFGETYALHRLVLSRSSYFRALMRGPWADAASPRLTLTFDDAHVDRRAVEASLAFLYDKLPTLDAESAPRVLAAAAFLDLEDLCRHCADFIVADVREETFVAYQRVAETRDHGEHGERVRAACWGYMCAQGSRELASRLHELSHATLDRLLGSDELWVPNESARFALARRVFADATTFAATATETETETAAIEGVARLVANDEHDATSVVREMLDHLLDEMDGSSKTKRVAKSHETRRREDASLAASTLARCVRYQHVPFETLEEMRHELDGDERVFPDREDDERDEREERDDPTRSPTRAVLEGLWTQTLLRSRVAKMCRGEEKEARRVRGADGVEDGGTGETSGRARASRRARGRRRPARLPSAKVSSRRTGRTFRFGSGWSSRTREAWRMDSRDTAVRSSSRDRCGR